MIRHTSRLLVGIGLFLGQPLPAAVPPAAPPGRRVMVGGGLRADTEAVSRAILAGRQGAGPLCIIPTAGATPETAMDGPVRNFDGYGGAGTARGVLISWAKLETARDPAVVAQLKGCSGFYFIGGVQSRVTAAFRPQGASTPAYDMLMQRGGIRVKRRRGDHERSDDRQRHQCRCLRTWTHTARGGRGRR